MRIEIVQFIATMLTVMALVPGGAHLLELPNKMKLDRDAYLTVQPIYRGWALAGLPLAGSLIATLWLAWFSRTQPLPPLLASTAFLLLLATLISFFVFIFPVNKATRQWTMTTDRFDAMRARWEYTHAANAVLTLLAVAATLAAGLSWRGC